MHHVSDVKRIQASAVDSLAIVSNTGSVGQLFAKFFDWRHGQTKFMTDLCYMNLL